MLLSAVCQSWFGMVFSTCFALTGVLQQAPSSLDGHSNSAGLSSIIGRDSFAALFLVSENFSFLTRLFVVKFGFVVLVSVHWITLTCLSYCPSVTSPSKFLLGVLKSDGFAAFAVAMMLMLAIFVCFQFCGYGGGRSPVSAIRGSALLAATLGLRHIWSLLPLQLAQFWFPVILGPGAGTMVTALLIILELGYSAQLLGEGLLKRKGQSSTSVLPGNLKKYDSFFPQANLSSIQVALGTAAAAHLVAFWLIVALQVSSGTAAASDHLRVYDLLLHVTVVAFVPVLLITFFSVQGLSVAALLSALTVFKAVLSSSSSSRAAMHISGHVLGLRIVLITRIVEMTMCARQALESQSEAGHRLASSPAVGTGVQATGRVDVPGEAYTELYMQKVAAAPCTATLQASALSERYGGGQVGKDSFSIPIFVRDLSGRTLSLRVSSQITGGDLSTTVSGVTGVPPDFFYLTIGGRILGCQDLFGNSGASSGIHVQMNGRLRGGARPPAVFIPGQWTCGVCGMEGCWPARTRCYRCNAPRSGAPPSQASPIGPPRENAYPGKPIAPQSVPVNPARRAPRRPAFKQATPAAAPVPGPLPVGPVDLGNAHAISQIMQALATMGLPDLLLQQIRSSIPPAPVTKAKDLSNEQRLARLGSKIKILEQQSAKLDKNKNRLQEELQETEKKLVEKCVELEDAKTEYRNLRDTGKFTPTQFVSPAASMNGDGEDNIIPDDSAEATVGVDPGFDCGSNDLISEGAGTGDMDVSGSAPIQTKGTGGLGKRRCLEFVAPPIDVLSAGFTQYSEADCNILMDRMKRHLEDLEDARGSEVLIDIDTDIENDPSLSCG